MILNARNDEAVQATHAALLLAYRTRKECLIHNDLHLGNILVGVEPVSSNRRQSSEPTSSLFLIDCEFATVGFL